MVDAIPDYPAGLGRLNAAQRLDVITDLVAHGQRPTVAELSDRFGVSAVTIRRDLQQLEDAGRIVRTHGGAAAAFDTIPDKSFVDRLDTARRDKELIGLAAAALIQPGDSVILDSGSTPFLAARALGDVRGLTVVTNSIPVIDTLEGAPSVEIVCLGGVLSRHSMAFTGPTVQAQLAQIHARLALVGADGLTVERGAQAAGAEAAVSARLMAEHAEQVVVLADASKLGRNAMSPYLSSERIHTIITAGQLDAVAATELDRLGAMGIHIILAEQPAFQEKRT